MSDEFVRLGKDHYYHPQTNLHIVYDISRSWGIYEDVAEKSISPRHNTLNIAIQCVLTIKEHPNLLRALRKACI